MRASRVRRPAFFSVGRWSSSAPSRARKRRWASAPACPATPPPSTLTLTSKRRSVSVSRSGARTICSSRRCPKYCIGLFSLIRTRPSPGCRRTRRVAVLRRPTARFSCCSDNLDVPLLVEGDALGRLRVVLVRGPGVDPEPAQHLGTQRVALQHPAHRVADGEGRVLLLLLV